MIHFLSGLPRAGSTLLGALLHQHPLLGTSPTSDLVELFVRARNDWTGLTAFQAWGLEKVRPRARRALAGLLRGFYAPELEGGGHVLDKSRAWPAYVDVLEDVLGRKVKVLCPLRDLREVIASFERLVRRHPLTAPRGQGEAYVRGQDVRGRAQLLLADDGAVGLACRRMEDALARGYSDRLCFVRYADLVADPVGVCATVFGWLGLSPVEVDRAGVVGPDDSRDLDVWGLDLHALRSRVDDDAQGRRWDAVLPEQVAELVHESFPFIQSLAGALA